MKAANGRGRGARRIRMPGILSEDATKGRLRRAALFSSLLGFHGRTDTGPGPPAGHPRGGLMRIIDPAQTEANPGNPDYFTGPVTLRRMAATDPPTNVKMFRVEFAAGARTHWHTHSGVQVLVVLEGRCRFQHKGGPVNE